MFSGYISHQNKIYHPKNYPNEKQLFDDKTQKCSHKLFFQIVSKKDYILTYLFFDKKPKRKIKSNFVLKNYQGLSKIL